jgi:hypothetical protein
MSDQNNSKNINCDNNLKINWVTLIKCFRSFPGDDGFPEYLGLYANVKCFYHIGPRTAMIERSA